MKGMDVRKIVVVVEDVEAARTALKWALHNLLRSGDFLTLLHVFSSSSNSSSMEKLRLLRLNGFQLALSFKDICNNSFFNTNVEIIVTKGDQEGGTIAALVREMGAFALVVGLHHQSFLYKLAMAHSNITSKFNCKVLAIKEPAARPARRTRAMPLPVDSSTSMDFSQIEIATLDLRVLQGPRYAST
ncbi:hypothetical protein MANES_05G117900v8 [Manihot esculenta]|uniref:Uncharacterized protein n=1 Tax=Manihot esculenta TaxID=3983 RepID=A0ACB7HPS6_MANES|nr:hypothetical protein MANES_05G117900v8 [Manihot esculenta]